MKPLFGSRFSESACLDHTGRARALEAAIAAGVLVEIALVGVFGKVEGRGRVGLSRIRGLKDFSSDMLLQQMSDF